MKVAVTAVGPDWDSKVDPRFGRAQYFLFIDIETMKLESFQNTGKDSMHGAGIQSGQLMSDKGVSAVITGQVGPNAYQTLSATGIKIYKAGEITVKEAVESFKKGGLSESSEMGPAHGGMRS
jgi:predicted Fe-Mo cluster-binding NifX family protein